MIKKVYTYKICATCKADKQETRSPYCKRCKAKHRLRYLGREKVYKQEKSQKYTKQLAGDICLFIDAIVKRDHWCSEEELFQVITFFEKIYSPTKYDDVFPLFNQICMMYVDLCRFYKDNKSHFLK